MLPWENILREMDKLSKLKQRMQADGVLGIATYGDSPGLRDMVVSFLSLKGDKITKERD
jgi:hypothetical protein